MIPYDDLVVALSAWRARQGLPVAQSPGVAPAATRAPAPAAARTTPPAPPKPARQVAPEREDFDDAALVEEAPYDTGDDYVVALGAEPGEPTAIGSAPEPVTEGLLVPKRGKRNPDW